MNQARYLDPMIAQDRVKSACAHFILDIYKDLGLYAMHMRMDMVDLQLLNNSESESDF